jgi:hypothetical protein
MCISADEHIHAWKGAAVEAAAKVREKGKSAGRTTDAPSARLARLSKQRKNSKYEAKAAKQA